MNTLENLEETYKYFLAITKDPTSAALLTLANQIANPAVTISSVWTNDGLPSVNKPYVV